MEDIILLKLGEVVLKGGNRRYFEKRLITNIRRRLKPYGEFDVRCAQSTIYVEPKGGTNVSGAFEEMKHVFGIISISRAAACEKDKTAILNTAVAYLAEDMKRAKSFKVESKRADKRFPMTSIELSKFVGGELKEKFPECMVDVHDPELTVNVEVRDYAAYVHSAPVSGAGGMPVGSNGKAVSLLSGGIDSPVSTYMIAKRGIAITPVHFFSFPYTSLQAREKVITLTKLLTRYCGDMTLRVVPFTRIQEEIRRSCPEELFTIIMRRFMMSISEKIAMESGCSAIITGESLGQVASQTMQAMAVTRQGLTMPVLSPLVGMDKEEIVRLSRRIGTFETSILPYEDCCTVFTPRHPSTKPRLDRVLEAEKQLDATALTNEAIGGIEYIKVVWQPSAL